MSMIDDSMVEALSRFLDVDVARYKLIGSNMANLDTPGYSTRDLDFRAELERAGMRARIEGREEEQEEDGGNMLAGCPTPRMLPLLILRTLRWFTLRWCGGCGDCSSVPMATTSAWSGRACCWPRPR